MSDFVSNLIARHTQTEGNVIPRVRGRFESEQSHVGFAPNETSAEPNSLFNQPNQTLFSVGNQSFSNKPQIDPELSPPVPSGLFGSMSKAERDWSTDPKPEPERAERTADFLPQNRLPNPAKNRPNEDMPEPVRQWKREQNLTNSQRVMPVVKNLTAPENKAFNTRLGGLLGEPNRLPEFRQNSLENRGEQTPASPAQPSIKVTIGRIEVRAVSSPNSTPTPAKSAPKPQLSLDDYLKQRNNRPT